MRKTVNGIITSNGQKIRKDCGWFLCWSAGDEICAILVSSGELTGSWKGLSQGMSASVDAFETPLIRMARGRLTGLQHDKGAIVKDVGRAEKKLIGSTAAKRKFTAAS